MAENGQKSFNFPHRIRAVTVEEVNCAAQELLHPDRWLIVSAG